MKHERLIDPVPEEAVVPPSPPLTPYLVFNASGVQTASYATSAAAAAHCAAWPSGAYYRGP